MLVSQTHNWRNPIQFTYDKPLPKGSVTEREQNPVQYCVCSPKGNGAYTNFFDMQTEKTCITLTHNALGDSAVQNLHTLTQQFGVDASKIQFTFRKGKVTASIRYNGRSYGVRGAHLSETLNNLKQRIANEH